MIIGYFGLGKMGKNMVLRLLEQGQDVYAWNRSPEPLEEVGRAGAKTFDTVEELVTQVRVDSQTAGQTPLFWLMMPAGEVTEQFFQQVTGLMQQGEIIIDGANSFYKDAVRRNKVAQEKEFQFLDVGVSGGPSGARAGACLMIGGKKETYDSLTPLFTAIAAPEAFGYFGDAGAGHFVKMVHNGIEYGMMQAIGEGYEVMKKSDLNLDLTEITRVYNKGSVIESRLIGWLQSAYAQYSEDLTEISGSVSHSGEGQWTVDTAKELGVPVKVIEDSLQFRIDSQQSPSYTGRVVSALRNQFGGHEVKA